MAELTDADQAPPLNSCCAPEAQATCCEPSAKAECCDPSHGEGCTCAAEAATPPQAPARLRLALAPLKT